MNANKYRTVGLVVRYGNAAVAVLLGLMAVGSIGLAATLVPLWAGAALLVGSAVVAALLKLLVEIVQIISETLLPQ